jgi:hypothetical protein
MPAFERLRQEDRKFKTSLRYIVRPLCQCIYILSMYIYIFMSIYIYIYIYIYIWPMSLKGTEKK